jgi:hypothetical protein
MSSKGRMICTVMRHAITQFPEDPQRDDAVTGLGEYFNWPAA